MKVLKPSGVASNCMSGVVLCPVLSNSETGVVFGPTLPEGGILEMRQGSSTVKPPPSPALSPITPAPSTVCEDFTGVMKESVGSEFCTTRLDPLITRSTRSKNDYKKQNNN